MSHEGNSSAMSPKYPHIVAHLSDQDGNAFMVLALCRRAAKEAGLSAEEVSAFYQEATSGGYEHLLQTAARWFTCE